MLNRLLFIFFILSFCILNNDVNGQALLKKGSDDQCIICHIAMGDKLEKIANDYKQSIHFEKGVNCVKCHGGDASSDDLDAAMSKDKGFIGVPKRTESYKLCVKCHSDQNVMNKYDSNLPTDQFTKLKMSVHSKNTIGKNEMIADCITCHGVHNIFSVNNPSSNVYPTKIVTLCGSCHSNPGYMKNYNSKVPVDQVEKYRTSIHGKLNQQGNIDAAECVSCHGNHEIRNVNDPKSSVYATNIPLVCSSCHSDEVKMKKYSIPTNQYALFVNSVHGQQLLQKMDLNAPSCNDCHGNHGAVPPGVESISKVCGTCHVLNMELFEQSPHKKAFDENDFPECESCHGNHLVKEATDEMVGTQKPSVCIDCHSAEVDDKGFMVAGEMRKLIDSLKSKDSQTKVILDEAGQKGMDVSDAAFSLKDVRQVLIQSRTTIHAFNLDKFKEQIGEGFTIVNKAKITGEEAIDEFYYRRIGLGISTIVVTLLVIGLYIKLKKVEKKS
jgi:predicted CXXCH cytochrome family protein